MILRRVVALLAAAVVLTAGCGSGDVLVVPTTVSAPATTVAPVDTVSVDTVSADAVPADTASVDTALGDQQTSPRFSDLPVISADELPIEAYEILVLIDQGGPFRFDKDGSTFQNRERLLPQRERGHYQEYTVLTPGDDDRGPRRIVAGADGERYWTDDHYDSFSEIVDWEGR